MDRSTSQNSTDKKTQNKPQDIVTRLQKFAQAPDKYKEETLLAASVLMQEAATEGAFAGSVMEGEGVTTQLEHLDDAVSNVP